MNKLWITAVMAGLMLAACSSNKEKTAAPEANLTVEQAMQECQKTVGATQDQAAFDACMKEKGFERPANASAPAAPAQ
ncbi:hypothetical protein [Neisseria zoodegmatis]|uniref:Lipoprotein n=1 Tax=Neisseria zoodegmatis TaxID=326523 RepID=A0AB38DTE9_9NEIS|nr:hypothetical protein [Neisseria zoodegmatis]OSI10983.1 hypothetical protein BWD10_03490 [Neisseria zoodegmatis]SNU80228.1 Uncharacterised protein [Neisseria zoodegmatis]